jgi:hypothetical protein
MPADQRVWAHHREQFAPFDQVRQQHERDPRRVVGPLRPGPAFEVAGELLPEEQVLGSQLGARPAHQSQQTQEVADECGAVRITGRDDTV